MGELAVRAVGFAPLVEQGEDLGHLALEQPLRGEGGGEGELDLGVGLLDRTTSVSHLRETRSSMMSTAIPAAVKCVVS